MSEHTCMGGDPGSPLNERCLACDDEIADSMPPRPAKPCPACAVKDAEIARLAADIKDLFGQFQRLQSRYDECATKRDDAEARATAAERREAELSKFAAEMRTAEVEADSLAYYADMIDRALAYPSTPNPKRKEAHES